MKIPVLEQYFLKVQREKIGTKSNIQIGCKDVAESKRLDKHNQRKEREFAAKRLLLVRQNLYTLILFRLNWKNNCTMVHNTKSKRA